MAENEEILEGKVQAIMTFGAFITLKDGSTGLVHISEISDGYVKDVNDYLKEGQTVRVIELPSDDKTNKKRLSIKRTGEKLKPLNQREENREGGEEGRKQKRSPEEKKKTVPEKKDFSMPPPMFDEGRQAGNGMFEDKLAAFMKSSEERLIDLKHQKENKRGGGYIRRG